MIIASEEKPYAIKKRELPQLLKVVPDKPTIKNLSQGVGNKSGISSAAGNEETLHSHVDNVDVATNVMMHL